MERVSIDLTFDESDPFAQEFEVHMEDKPLEDISNLCDEMQSTASEIKRYLNCGTPNRTNELAGNSEEEVRADDEMESVLKVVLEDQEDNWEEENVEENNDHSEETGHIVQEFSQAKESVECDVLNLSHEIQQNESIQSSQDDADHFVEQKEDQAHSSREEEDLDESIDLEKAEGRVTEFHVERMDQSFEQILQSQILEDEEDIVKESKDFVQMSREEEVIRSEDMKEERGERFNEEEMGQKVFEEKVFEENENSEENKGQEIPFEQEYEQREMIEDQQREEEKQDGEEEENKPTHLTPVRLRQSLYTTIQREDAVKLQNTPPKPIFSPARKVETLELPNPKKDEPAEETQPAEKPKLTKEEKKRFNSLIKLAGAHLEKDEFREALNYYQEALSIFPDHPKLRKKMEAVLAKLEINEEAPVEEEEPKKKASKKEKSKEEKIRELEEAMAPKEDNKEPPVNEGQSVCGFTKKGDKYVKGEFRIKAEIFDKLFGYQKEGFAWLCSLHSMKRGGGILGDDMVSQSPVFYAPYI